MDGVALDRQRRLHEIVFVPIAAQKREEAVGGTKLLRVRRSIGIPSGDVFANGETAHDREPPERQIGDRPRLLRRA